MSFGDETKGLFSTAQSGDVIPFYIHTGVQAHVLFPVRALKVQGSGACTLAPNLLTVAIPGYILCIPGYIHGGHARLFTRVAYPGTSRVYMTTKRTPEHFHRSTRCQSSKVHNVEYTPGYQTWLCWSCPGTSVYSLLSAPCGDISARQHGGNSPPKAVGP